MSQSLDVEHESATPASTRDEVTAALMDAVRFAKNRPRTNIVSTESKRHAKGLAEEEPLSVASTTDLLEAYVIVYLLLAAEIRSSRIRGLTPAGVALGHLNNVLHHALSRSLREPTSTDEIVAVLLAHPEHAISLAHALLRKLPKLHPAQQRTAPGLLTKEVHEAADMTPKISRTSYLHTQLTHLEATRLTQDQHTLAWTLSREWEGTLPSLIETAQRLAPIPVHSESL
jgi:hypothetical protein